MPIRLLQEQCSHIGHAKKERRRNSRATAKHVEDAELNTWRSARKHADPEPSREDVATVHGRVIAACAAAGMGGERSYCKRRIVAPVLGMLRIAVRTEHLEVCRHSQPVLCLVFRAKKTQLLGQMPA